MKKSSWATGTVTRCSISVPASSAWRRSSAVSAVCPRISAASSWQETTSQHSALPRGCPSSARAWASSGCTCTESQSWGSRNLHSRGKSPDSSRPVTNPAAHACRNVNPSGAPERMNPLIPGIPETAQHSPMIPSGTAVPNQARSVVPPHNRSANTGSTTSNSGTARSWGPGASHAGRLGWSGRSCVRPYRQGRLALCLVPPIVALEDIHVVFATRAVLAGVTLGIDRGQRVGVVGRNGDGKSTLFRVLAGVAEPDAGRVIRTADARVVMVGQSDALPPGRARFAT